MELTKSYNKLRPLMIISAAVIIVAAVAFLTTDPVDEGSRFYGTFWALVPPIVAIILALVTKNVYLSLFIGILMGAVFIGDGNLELTIMSMMDASNAEGDSWGFLGGLDTGILFFLVVLGIIGCMLLISGGSRAYGEWALAHVKTRKGAQIMTAILGALIFIDDYFNCLTVGQVMRPVTDKFHISRAKLAYLIDSMAAPICIIAPVSSWAAAVTSYIDEADGFELFVQSIGYNFYALFTIVMVVVIALIDFDFGPMKKHEDNAKNGDLYTTPDRPYANEKEVEINPRGKVYDLLIPIFLFLVPACITFLIWTGGFFDASSDFYGDFIGAMGNADASTALAYGSMAALVLTIIYLLGRRTVTFSQTMDCIPQGFKNMVPAITILVFAWAICAITRYGLGAPDFVKDLVGDGGDLVHLLPAAFMVLACFISFSTGTSWGTFGILLPIVYSAFSVTNPELMIVGISACLSGAVFGDHCSPISDTTIMSSAGAQCSHLNHVSTQTPYAVLVAAVAFVFFVIAGFWQSLIVTLIGLIVMAAVLIILKKMQDKGMNIMDEGA